MPPFDPPVQLDEIDAEFADLNPVRPLDEGGQGAVFLCTDPDGQELALKLYGAGTDAVRVDREIQKLATIKSPHVVPLVDHGIVHLRGLETRYTATGFIAGQDLRSLAGKLDDAEICRLLADVSLGIEALWSEQVVHRDLKPANIMRTPAGDFVIIDLGYAKHRDVSTVTQPGFTFGTNGYMSPEQMRGEPLTFRSDLFALGLVAYEIATGTHPYGRNQLLVGRIPIRPLEQVAAVSGATSQVVMRLLSPSPVKRARSCQDVRQQLGGP